MKKLILVLLCFLLALPSAFAARRADSTQLKVAGVLMSGYPIPANNVVTSDAVYQTGNVGYETLVTQINGNVSSKYQVSYDNSNWYTPFSTNGNGFPVSIGTIDTVISTNRWNVLPYILSPYIRFIFTNNNLTVTQDAVTAECLWQTES